MAKITFNGASYVVDHAAKGADYVHGYDANGNLVFSLEGIKDFSVVTYDGAYMSPVDCMTEGCNTVKYCGGRAKTNDGRVLEASSVGAATIQDVNTAKEEAKTYTNTQVRTAAPRNLLDNSDFRNPVNQRGQASYTEDGYTVDRWLSYNERLTVTLRDGYLELVSTGPDTVHFIQKLERILPAGQRITFAVALADGSILSAAGTVTSDGGICNMYSNDFAAYYNVKSGWATFAVYAGKTVKLKWAAIYEGEYTPETLPAYQPKGYGAELAECRRYYRKSWVGSLGEMVPNGATSFVCSSGASSQPVVSWEQPMAGTPTTVKVYSWVGGAGCVRDWCSSADVSGVAVSYISPFGFALTNLSGLTAGKVYAFHYEASADI